MQEEKSASGAKAPGRRGRPRDPQIESRVHAAALSVYGAHGWPGFHFEAVYRQAGVGKDALYRRWNSREALLADALAQTWKWLELVDTGTLRGDLLALGRMVMEIFDGPFGDVALQLRADARRYPEVREFAEPYRDYAVLQGRGIVRRAIARGDIPPSVNPGLIMDLLVGAIVNRIVSTPSRLKTRMTAKSDQFVTSAVELIINGVNGAQQRAD